MKVHRNTIYITLLLSIVSALIYADCIWCSNNWASNEWHEYISNMILGVWGSSIISLILGIISYQECRKKCLEQYISARRNLFNHCSKFKENNGVQWFDEYTNLYHILKSCWMDIWFVFDPRRHRLFLKKIVDFYGDFIQLAQDDYFLLTQDVNDATKTDVLETINTIVINRKVINRGVMKFNINENRFTHDMEMTIKNIYDIYRNKGVLKKYDFTKTLITKDNFTVLDSKYEKYLRKIIKQVHKVNKTEIEFIMPIEEAEYLIRAGYLENYTHGDGKMTSMVNCRFIVEHYFDMKKRATINE